MAAPQWEFMKILFSPFEASDLEASPIAVLFVVYLITFLDLLERIHLHLRIKPLYCIPEELVNVTMLLPKDLLIRAFVATFGPIPYLLINFLPIQHIILERAFISEISSVIDEFILDRALEIVESLHNDHFLLLTVAFLPSFLHHFTILAATPDVFLLHKKLLLCELQVRHTQLGQDIILSSLATLTLLRVHIDQFPILLALEQLY
mmetsp:Transcript_7749/g.7205  ORF Transcript_7749/g.7205 Transcript_7749/m.7205 type:complete len:206 (+) Transcript_7749:2138-2755(+)